MRAMIIERFGGPEVLQAGEIERPSARAGEVVVQVAYAGVNPADWKVREGWLASFIEYRFPFVLGFDAAGIVAEVGEGVDELRPGDRVVAATNQGLGERGAYAQYVVAVAERVAKLAPEVSLRDAATLPTAGMTAWEAVFDVGGTKAGSRVLVHGGAGGTGGFAIQLARMAGARVAATCGPANLDYVRRLGAERAIDYRAGNVLEAVREWAPVGVDLVVDTVGQGTLLDAPAITRRGGIVAPIATLVPNEPGIDAQLVQSQGVQLRPTTSTYPNQPRQLRALAAALVNGGIRAPETTVMPLAEAADAHRRIQQGHVRGKIVLEVDATLGGQ